MGAALGLLRLQKVDSSIHHAQTRLDKIRETLDNNQDLAAARGRVQSAETERDHAEASRSSRNLEARTQRAKIEQAESSLYGGTVRNPKELQDLQADVLSLKKHLAKIEELEFEAMVKLEAAQNDVRTASADLEQVGARLENEHGLLRTEQEELLRSLANLRDERTAALSDVDSTALQTYERLSQSHRGVAVAEISENACGACGTRLTAALQQSVRHSSELVLCPSCGRILFGD